MEVYLRINFYLKLKDEDIIIKFKECLECDYPIRRVYYGRYDSLYSRSEFPKKKSCNKPNKMGLCP